MGIHDTYIIRYQRYYDQHPTYVTYLASRGISDAQLVEEAERYIYKTDAQAMPGSVTVWREV